MIPVWVADQNVVCAPDSQNSFNFLTEKRNKQTKHAAVVAVVVVVVLVVRPRKSSPFPVVLVLPRVVSKVQQRNTY